MEDKLWWFIYPGSDCCLASWLKKTQPKKPLRKKENFSQADHCCYIEKKPLNKNELDFSPGSHAAALVVGTDSSGQF